MYLLQEKSIIYRNPTGHISCTHFDSISPLASTTKSFAQTSFYQNVVSSISETLKNNQKITEAANLIIDTKLFSRPGLIKVIIDKFGTQTKIQSDLQFAISSQNLKSGEYSIIDISEHDSYHYNFAIENAGYSLLKKTKLDNNKLKRMLAKKFASSQGDSIFNSLFNYSNIIEANQFLAINEITEADYSIYTLSEIALGSIFQDTYFSDFFNFLCSSIQDFVYEHISSEKLLLIKSPLTGFHPVKPILNSDKKIRVVNELDFLNESTASECIQCKTRNEGFELKCYPSNKKIVFPFSTWILSETGNLSIELFNEKESFLIDLIDLKEKLSDTFFTINDKQLVKYFAEFEMDTCNNIHFKIETLDREEFYYLINN
ncbi:MAG: hypothetical protein JWQ09_3143 [Segetibacter sp.]|nr:hypothetical protein [Segetibacter sp.]